MLNRRILRSKALQLAYGYYSSKKANFQMALDRIRENYAPDLNSLEAQDKEGLKEKEKLALKMFNSGEYKAEDVAMSKILVESKNLFNELDSKDLTSYKRQLTNHADRVFELYLAALLLFVKLADLVNIEAFDTMKNKPMAPKPDDDSMKFYHNHIVKLLRNSKEFEKYCTDLKVNWGSDGSFVENLYKESLKKNAAYKEYVKKPISKVQYENEMEICHIIFNEVIFNHSVSDSQFEEMDISWFQNKGIVKSMVKFTLKSLEENSKVLPFAPLAKNWEEDKSFYENLFNFTIANDSEYESLIAASTKNWDKERISLMDKIILKLALSELQNFPSIPVKVTINEYIDLSKQYSTPKSKTFVNGVLDKLADDLKKNGKIKKSGRGLIDNK